MDSVDVMPTSESERYQPKKGTQPPLGGLHPLAEPLQKSKERDREKEKEVKEKEAKEAREAKEKEKRTSGRLSTEDLSDGRRGDSMKRKLERTTSTLMIQPQKHARPWDKIPLRAMLSVRFLLILLNLGLAISAYFAWTSPEVQYNDLVYNWESAPISNVKLMPLGSDCPSGYQLVAGEKFDSGFLCDCGGKNVKLTPCDKVDTTCTKVLPLSSVDLPAWREYRICIQRHPDGEAVNAVNRQGGCSKAGWKNCSATGKGVCVPQSADCPITTLAIVNTGPTACPPGTVGTAAFPANITNPVYVCSSRDGEVPLVDVHITLGGRCVHPNNFNPFSKENPQEGPTALSVDVSIPPFPCEESSMDTRFHDIDLRTMGAIYKDNRAEFVKRGVHADQISYWTQISYPVFYKLQARPEIYFSTTCSHSMQEVIDANEELHRITRAQAGVVLVSIVTSVLVDFPWLVWSCSGGYKTYHKKTTTHLAKCIFSIFSNIISSILLGISFYSLYHIFNLFWELNNAKCGDKPTTAMFESYDTELTTMAWLDSLVFIWGIISIFLDLRIMIVLPSDKKTRLKDATPAETELLDPNNKESEDRVLPLAPIGLTTSFNYGRADTNPSSFFSRNSRSSLADETRSLDTRRSTGSFGRISLNKE